MDCHFPIITYAYGKSPYDWGFVHGEQHRDAIHELAQLRREKLLDIIPQSLHSQIDVIADKQWQQTEAFSAELASELQGLSDGAKLSKTDLMILNNYTDFRDMVGEDQGCSCVFAKTEQALLAGQTWDMHSSAKNYVCVIDIQGENGSDQVVFSLVGCLGMAGFTTNGTVVGVNNLNTKGAQAGVIWPAAVRKMLTQKTTAEMNETISSFAVSSGRNYMIASHQNGAMWEVSPTDREQVSHLNSDTNGVLLHTNHCLGSTVSQSEISASAASTTHPRMKYLEQKSGAVKNFVDMRNLLGDHEGYPISICSHYESTPHDPSHTCGGMLGDLRSGKVILWRGCRDYDDNYVEHQFDLTILC